MILRSSTTPTPAELRATINALGQICEDYEDEIASLDGALVVTHATLLHLTSVLKYTMQQPDQVDFAGIIGRLEDTCSMIIEVIS